ncbi:hypothetical protein TNCV_4266781 [Trichonephila clavipes]|nr:hypothetical protein TNCV_4266781 [Trichonephila clavipes]
MIRRSLVPDHEYPLGYNNQGRLKVWLSRTQSKTWPPTKASFSASVETPHYFSSKMPVLEMKPPERFLKKKRNTVSDRQLVMDFVILKRDQVARATSELATPLHPTTSRQREDSQLDR